MPTKIDRIGRAHEWLTAYFLSNEAYLLEKANTYLKLLDSLEQKRVRVGSKHTAEGIKLLEIESEIVKVKCIGDKSKKSGPEDYDIMIYFKEGENKGYSLKIQKNPQGVNVRNPTMNSLCKFFTRKDFEKYLKLEEIKKYELMGKDYINKNIESREVGHWGAVKLSEILNGELKKDCGEFSKILLQEVRYKTNFILTIVDKNGNFIGQITKFNPLFKEFIKDPSKLKILPRGISVHMMLNEKKLVKIDVYMQSNSKGRLNKLRLVLRPDFILNRK